VTVPQRAQAAEDARPQRLASSRLMPIRAPSETTNLIAAHVNVGTGAGGKPGAETSVGRMMNTFKQISRFWGISEKIRAIVPLGSSYLSDLHANVCSRRDTRLSVMLPIRLCRAMRDSHDP